MVGHSEYFRGDFHHIWTAVIAFCLAIAASTQVSGEPIILEQLGMEEITAGTSNLYRSNSMPRINSFRQVSTYISIPTARAVAVCYFCSGNAYANARSTAVGHGIADSSAYSQGSGRTEATTFAYSPPPWIGGLSFGQPYFGQ